MRGIYSRFEMRIAIWLHGGIGGGNFSQGQPTLSGIVGRLSRKFLITVYSILPPNDDFVAQGFRFRTVDHRIRNSGLRAILLTFLFLFDHFKLKYAIIHSFWGYPSGAICVMLGKLIKKPAIVTLQGGEAAAIKDIRYGHLRHPTTKKILLWTLENASCICSVSDFLIKELQRKGLKRRDCLVIPFGADRDIFFFNKKDLDQSLRIIHVANLTAVKDQATLLKTFQKIRTALPSRLKIIGADYLNGKLQELAQSLGLNSDVEFVPAVRQKDLGPYYGWAHLMIHTSLHEGLPTVAVEAMMSGVVVCGTSVGILNDFKDQFLRAVDPGDYITLAEEVIKLWQDPPRYLELQSKAFEWASGHDIDWTVNQYADLYERLELSILGQSANFRS